MATNKITCATKLHPHRHITKVGGGGKSWTVAQAIQAIKNGDVFYTVSPTTSKVAIVRPVKCSQCPTTTLRSYADGVPDNNLDNLPNCR